MRRWSNGADAAGGGPAALERTLQSTAADALMEDVRLTCVAPSKKEDWTLAFCTQHDAAARARDMTGCPTRDAAGVLISPQPSVENGTLGNAQDAGPPSVEDLEWTPAFCGQHVDAARVRDETGRRAQFDDGVLPTLPPHPQPSAGNEPPANTYAARTTQFANLEWMPG